jgi:signal transduction histidine kinase
MKWKRLKRTALAGLLAIAVSGVSANTDNTVVYQYHATKKLIATVQAAAKLFHQKGSRAFAEFRKKDSRWLHKYSYLFIYNLKGTNVFHGMEPSLEGKNIVDFKDIDGRPVIKEMIAIAADKKRGDGWVHYHWAGPDHFFPTWKSSYVMRVTDPAGKAYFIGAGIYSMKTEKIFIVDVVDRLVALIESKGVNYALEKLSSEASPYSFKNNYPFIIDGQGRAIFDPAFPNLKTRVHRNLYNFTDAVGKKTIQILMNKIKIQSSAWVMYMWPKPDQTEPARKLIYAKRVMVDGKLLIVGSELFVETPIWMSG